METGNSTAGDGYKQDREHILSVYVKACKCLQVTGRIGYKYTDNRTNDHKDQKITVQIITWLKQCPYRSDTGDQNRVSSIIRFPNTATRIAFVPSAFTLRNISVTTDGMRPP